MRASLRKNGAGSWCPLLQLRFWRAIAFVIAVPVSQAEFTFTKIATGDGPGGHPFSYISAWASLNDLGGVAFIVQLDGGTGPFDHPYGLFTGPDFATDKILIETPTPENPAAYLSGLEYNIAGQASFLAPRGIPSSNSVYLATTAGEKQLVAAPNETYGFLSEPHLNNNGMVTFMAEKVFNAGVGADSLRFSASGTLEKVFEGRVTDINSSGEFVGIQQRTPQSASTLYTGFDLQHQTFITDSRSYFVRDATLNDFGSLAFIASRPGSPIAYGVYTATNSSDINMLAGSNSFESISSVAINNSGLIVFSASRSGLSGVYVGLNGTTNKIIQFGDPLFGSTLANVYFGPSGLNNEGQVAFTYFLANGENGVAIASIPEPGVSLFFLCGIGWRAARRHRSVVGH